MDWLAFRKLFPAVGSRTYLNTAGGGAMSVQSANAGRAYYTESETYADVFWDEWNGRARTIRNDVAKFISGNPVGISFLQNTSLGLNIVARLYDEPVEVLAIDKEFPSCTIPWLRAGHSVRFIETESSGAITAEAVDLAIRSETRAFVLSSVQFANGYRADLESIGRVCRNKNVQFVVDATQSICAYEIDVEGAGIDALVFSGYKWATAGYGIAVLYLGPALMSKDPPLVGWRSAVEPYLLENHRLNLAHTGIGHEMGHPTFPGIFSLGEALKLFSEVGVPQISSRIDELTEGLRGRLEHQGFPVISSAGKGTRSGILKVVVDQPDTLAEKLRRKDIWTSARDGALRVSMHAYNNEDDVDVLVSEMREILA